MSDLQENIEKYRKKEEIKKRQIQLHNEAKKAACECFATDSGKTFLRWLVNDTGYQLPSAVYNAETGEFNVQSTVYNEARRGVYLKIRNLLNSRPDILAEVENNIKGGN